MIDYVSILAANSNGILATQDGDKVRTRMLQYLFTEENKVYLSTSNKKALFAQLQANPNVSFCTYSESFTSVLSVYGKVVFEQDCTLRARALDANRLMRNIYTTPENPSFELFYIDVEEVVTFDFANGKQTYVIAK
ncbi:MAG: pyridoxamine 5'-phosphate oxidase family protein [Clostridiales Family XIII bacterium]|jgi:uncharacterized pyridoxamine 5'-phosphate oxidase family protein|nr:pyridoxamine 5'-phosphate oxidase family protein [Clostridiales Family XIII bacterium]